MDRVPPQGAAVWRPKGEAGPGENPLDWAEEEALGNIWGVERRLEQREWSMEDAKEDVVNFKA